MPRATLAVDLRPDSWIAELSSRHPGAEFRLLAAVPLEADGGTAVLSVAGEDGTDLDAVLDGLADESSVSELAVVRERDGERLVHLETTAPFLQRAYREAGVPVEPPLTVREGEARLSVTTAGDRLSAFAEALRGAGHEVRVESLHQRVEDATVLTDRQEAVVKRAVEAAYYDTPRETSLSELADRLDRAKSSVSETLHRAESNLAKRYVTDREALAGVADGAAAATREQRR